MSKTKKGLRLMKKINEIKNTSYMKQRKTKQNTKQNKTREWKIIDKMIEQKQFTR